MADDVSQTTGLAPTELVQIEGDDIVIRVSLDALVFATENGCLCTFSQLKNDFRTPDDPSAEQQNGPLPDRPEGSSSPC